MYINFNKVKECLEEKTKNTDNFLTLTKNTDCRHNGKYVTKNVVTGNISNISFKTLKEVIEYYNLI